MDIFGKRKAAPQRIKAGGVAFDPPPADPVEGYEPEPISDVLDESAGEVAEEQSSTVPVSDPEPQPVEAQDAPEKRGMFGRSAGPKAPKEPKAAKEPKAPKPDRAPKVAKIKPVEEAELPVTVVIDFYQGVYKEREAEQIARAWIEKNFDAPNASYLYTQRWREGVVVEMQEGGGRAYLPEVLAKLDQDPTATVIVAMSNRVAQVRLDPDTKTLETLLLVTNQSPPDDAFIALPTRQMRPFDRRGSRVFVAGAALLAASVIALMFSVGALFIDTKAWALPYIAQTAVKDLPSAQFGKVKSTLETSDCVYKLEYANGAWTVVPGFDNGGTCGLTRPVTEPQPPDPNVPLPPGVVPGIQPGSAGPGAILPPGMTPGVIGSPAAPPGATPPGATPPGAAVPVTQ